MKYVIRATPILVALALFVSFLVIQQTRSVTAVVDGITLTANGVADAPFVSNTSLVTTTRTVTVDANEPGGGTTTVVNVTNLTRGVTITGLVLKGTAPSYTGSFEVNTVVNQDLSAGVLGANDGDVIRVTAPGFQGIKDITVDGVGPTILITSPVHNTITQATGISFTATITDLASGIATPATDAIDIFLQLAPPGGPLLSQNALATYTETTGGFDLSMILLLALGREHEWYIRANDIAGNITRSDSDAATEGDQTHVVEIDLLPPVLLKATTGEAYDAAAGTITTNNRNSIHLTFVAFGTTLPDKLKASSLAPSDFLLGDPGVAPTAVTFPDLDIGEGVNVTGLDLRSHVFLTVGVDLLSNATTLVRIVGSIEDIAGKVQTTGQVTAEDGIGPKLTIIGPTPSLAKAGDTVTIDITSDETLAEVPLVQIIIIETNTTTTVPATSVGTNTWRVTQAALTASSAVNVSASGNDLQANTGTAGLADNADPAAEGAVIYEQDIALGNPVVTPAEASTPSQRDPFFIIVDWGTGTAETGEYIGDTHTLVTVTKFELDGVSMLSGVGTIDNKKFLVAVSGITLGAHTVTINGTDEAGNALAADLAVAFTVQLRPALKVTLNPGWNLVSLPGNPADDSIDAVMANTPDADSVVTYDPTVPGGFLVAVRDAGNWIGTLKTMDASAGYWVFTTSFLPIEVDVPLLQAGAAGVLPPIIPIAKGWNLVPVGDPTGLLAPGTGILSSTYFAGATGVIRVYYFNTVLNAWELIASGDNVLVGRAYWAFSTAAGSLVP